MLDFELYLCLEFTNSIDSVLPPCYSFMCCLLPFVDGKSTQYDTEIPVKQILYFKKCTNPN